MLNSFYDNNYFEIAEVDNNIQPSGDRLTLLINDETTQNDVEEYFLLACGNEFGIETPLIVSVHVASLNSRKSKHILDILNLILERFDTEDLLVQWYYEATDERSYEVGLKIQLRTRINFSFQVY